MSDTFDKYSPQTEEEKFFEFVNQQVEKFTSYTRMKGQELSFSEVNHFLLNYGQILLSLISMHTFSQFDYDREKEKFDDWFSDKFIILRNRENRSDLAAQKWMSQKEIEMLVRKEYNDVYVEKKHSLLMTQRKVEFIHDMIKSWEAQQFILSNLSKNLQSEVSINFTN